MPSIHISISRQSLELRDDDNHSLWQTCISSGLAGIGTQPDSGQTPTGRFRIATRHGEGAPAHCCFCARLPLASSVSTAPKSPPLANSDPILARILTLDGIDEHNANTRARYIYIHGTADIERLGTACSHGCIRLSPQAMITLFEHSPLGTLVTISP